MAQQPSYMRTPLAKVRGLGSARSGTVHFWRQRLTGVLLVPLTFAFVFVLLAVVRQDYNVVRQIVGNPFVSILLLLFVLSSIYHMRIGMQVILEDYLHVEGVKIGALLANDIFCVLVGVACVYAVLKVGFT